MSYQPQNYILGSQPPSRQNSHGMAGMPQADDGTGFLLANAISLGGRSGSLGLGSFGMPGALADTNSGGGFNFDMEWAYYSMIEQPGQQQDAGANIAMRDGTGNGIVPLTVDAIPTGVGAGVGDLAVVNERVEKRKLEVDEEAPQADGEPKRSKGKAVWRKYGQKTLKGKDYTGMKMLRCYYRCNHPGCQVKKQVETSAWSNEVANVTIHGIHNHPVEQTADDQAASTAQQNSTISTLQMSNQSAVPRNLEPKPTPPLDQNFADLVMRAAPHFVVADPHKQDCPIIFASAGFTALTGYGPAETLGRNCRFLQGKDTNVHAVRQLTKAIKANREIHIILLNYKKDLTPFWNLLHLTPILGADGTLHSIVGAQLDVSGFVNGSNKKEGPRSSVDVQEAGLAANKVMQDLQGDQSSK